MSSLDLPSLFGRHFCKGDNFYIIVFASLLAVKILQKGLLLKERICSTTTHKGNEFALLRQHIISFRSNPNVIQRKGGGAATGLG